MYYKNHANGNWLSVSDYWYAGFYSGWASARSCVYDKENRRFTCEGQALSLYSKDNGYLYFWDAYGPLQVDFDYED